VGGIFLARFLSSIFRSAWSSLRGLAARKWLTADAIVTSNSERLDFFDASVVEIAYSYRVHGELYTGLHEEPCFLNESEYRLRFPVGRTFVVRVKLGEPEVSVLRDDDQADGILQRLQRIGQQ
jgi:hypothetical protein